MRRNKGNLIIGLLFLAILIMAVIASVLFQYHCEIKQFYLSEVQDGIYAIKETVIQAIPAQNFSMLTVCDYEGNIITVIGKCHINYSYGAPYAILKDYNMRNMDDITVYIPYGTAAYMGTTYINASIDGK